MCSQRTLRLIDPMIWFKLAGLMILVFGVFMTVAYGQEPATVGLGVIHPPSLWEKWLTPEIVMPAALALLYVGELRGELKRLKIKVAEFEIFNDSLFEKLDNRYMSRETTEARFREFQRFTDRNT